MSSEREAHITAERTARFVDIARDRFRSKHIDIIDWVNSSIALTFDAATQNDGMHVVGPPMKALFNQLMHTMCYQKHDKQHPNKLSKRVEKKDARKLVLEDKFVAMPLDTKVKVLSEMLPSANILALASLERRMFRVALETRNN